MGELKELDNFAWRKRQRILADKAAEPPAAKMQKVQHVPVNEAPRSSSADDDDELASTQAPGSDDDCDMAEEFGMGDFDAGEESDIALLIEFVREFFFILHVANMDIETALADFLEGLHMVFACDCCHRGGK